MYCFFIRSSTFLFWLPFSPQQRQMLLTPSMVAVINVLVYTVYLNTCLPPNTSSSGSSSSAGGFGVHQSADAATQDSIIAAAAAAASATVHRSWIYLRHQAEQGTAAFRRHVSGTDAVLKQHGISNAAVAFLAAFVDYPDAVLSVQDLLRPAMHATHGVVGATYHMIYQQPQLRELLQLGPLPSASSAPGAQQQRRQEQQHVGSIGIASDTCEQIKANVLASQLLLYSILQQQQQQQQGPQFVGSSEFVSFCAEAAGVSKTACCAMAGHLSLLEQPPVNSQTSTTGSAGLAQLLQMLLSAVQTSTAGSAESAALRRVMKQWVDDALPVLVQLLQLLLSAASKARSSTTGSASSSSSSSGGGGNSNTQSAAATPAATTKVTPQRALVGMVQLLCIAAKASSWQEDDPDPSVKVKYLAQGWTAHHVQLCAAVDGAFRLLAAELANPALIPFLSDMLVGASECLFANSLGVLVVPANLSAPGSDKEMQLFSCLVSFVKFAGLAASSAVTGHGAFSTAGKQAIWQVVSAAVNYLVLKTAGATITTASPAAAEAVLNNPGSGLPWLWLIGRCFLLWVAQLRQLQQQYTALQLGQRLMRLQLLQGLTTAVAWQQTTEVLGVDKFNAAVAVFGAHHLPGLKLIRRDCTQWLLQNDNAVKLAADGYPTVALLQQLQAVTTSAAAAVGAEGPAAAAAAAEYGRSQLEALALSCQSLAISKVCNHPYCSNMQGATEMETVTGRSCRCSGFHVAQYCSRVCQKQHWTQHKTVCKALAAAQQIAGNS